MDIGLTKNTMVLFQKGNIALIRNIPSTIDSLQLPDSDDRKTDPLENVTPEEIESCVQSFCKEAKNTLHSFEWQTNMRNLPEKIFYTGTGALYPGTYKILSEHLEIPAEQITISSD